MTKRDWLLIVVAAVFGVIGYGTVALMSGHAQKVSHDGVRAGTFVAIYLPLFVAVMIAYRRRKKVNLDG